MEQCIVIEVEGDHDIHNNDDTHSGFGLPWDQCFSVPLLQLLPNPSLKRHILQLSAGTNHLAFVCNEGHLFTWGEGKDGQLGLGKDILQTCVPIRVDTKGKHIVKVSCGYVHTACLYIGTDVTAHPQLLGCLTFGAGLCGALGTGSDTVSCNVPRSVLVPAQVRHLLHDPSDEEQEQEHSFFNTAATPVSTPSSTPASTPSTSSTLSSITLSFQSIACGFAHMAAIVVVASSTSGRRKSLLFTWGWNKRGQLGVGGTENEFAPRLVNGLRRHQTVSIGCGFEMTAAVTEVGDLFVFGQGLEGQLGLGKKRMQCSEPLRHESLKKKCYSVACGADHTTVLLKEGRLLIWGRGAGERPRQVVGLPTIELALDERIDGREKNEKRWSLSCSEHSVHMHDKEGGVYEWPSNPKDQEEQDIQQDDTLSWTTVKPMVEAVPLHMATWRRGSSVVACTQFGAGDSWNVFVPSLPDFSKSQLSIQKSTVTAGEVVPIDLVVRDSKGRLVHHHYGYRKVLNISLHYEDSSTCSKEDHQVGNTGMNAASWDESDPKGAVSSSSSSSSSSTLNGMFSLTRAGQWTMHVTYDAGEEGNQHVLGSPIAIQCTPDVVSPQHCVFQPSSVAASNDQSTTVAGEKYYFDCVARDQYKNQVHQGGLSLLVRVHQEEEGGGGNAISQSLPRTSLVDLGTGVYHGHATLYNTGKYTLQVVQTLTATHLHSQGATTITTMTTTAAPTTTTVPPPTAMIAHNTNKNKSRDVYKRLTIKERAARNMARKKERQKIQCFLQKHAVEMDEGDEEDWVDHVDDDRQEQQCGKDLCVSAVPALGCALTTTVPEGVEKTITIGMTSTCVIKVKDQYHNQTILDETESFSVKIKPLSSHLLKNMVVPSVLEKISLNNTITVDEHNHGVTGTTASSSVAMNEYLLTYTPELRGAYSIEISLYNEPIVDSPFYIRVTENNASSLALPTRRVDKYVPLTGKPKWGSGGGGGTGGGSGGSSNKRDGLNRNDVKRRPQTAMARSRKRNMKTTKNKETVAGKDDSNTNPASPTARAPSPMLPPPSEMLSSKSTTPKQTLSTLYKVGKKGTKTKQRPQTASSVTKKRTKTKKNATFNKKKQRQPGHAKQAKRTRSSSKLSAHMLALCQARNINPLALKRKNSTKSSVSKQRPVSSMGIRSRQPLASKASTRNGGGGQGGGEEKATGIRSKQAPTIASNQAKENKIQPSTHVLHQSTHTKHRPASSPPKRRGGRTSGIQKRSHNIHNIIRAAAASSRNRSYSRRPNSAMGFVQQRKEDLFGFGSGVRGKISN